MNNHQPASSSSGTAATGSGSGSDGAGAGAVQQEDEGASSLASLSSSRRATSLQTALAQIREALPLVEQADTDTSDFLEALDRVPYLVEMESNPLQFLKREDFDVTKAAKRLSLYWQFRKQIFEERAFLPMTLTGEGALTPSDVQAFRKGYQIPLPPNLNGHSVVFTDKFKLYELNPSVRRRCGFYSFQVVGENEKSITEGFIATTLFGDMAAANSTHRTAALATDGIASKLHCNHVFALPVDEDKISQNNFFANFAGIMLTMLGMDVFQKTFLHVTNTPEENRAKLLAIGFTEDTIPPALGGTWGREKLDQWVKERIVLEKQRYAFLEAQQQPPRSLAAASDTKQAATAATAIGQQQHQLTQANTAALEDLRQQHLLQFLSSGMGGVGGGGNATSLANIHDVASSFAAAGMAPAAAAQPTTTDQLLLMQYLTASRNVPGITALFPEYLTGSSSSSSAAAARTTHHHHHSTSKLPPALPPQPPTTSLPSVVVSPEEEYRRHGIETVPTVPETEAIRQAARVAIEETLKTLPDEDKAAYVEARNKCPHLVQAESDTLRFARVENYNAFAAARRLVGYWKLRKVLFGDQRAFLPMTQTGHGALTRDDIVILSCGCVALGRKDSAGRGVVIGDRTKLLNKNEASQQARLRSIFYLLTVLSEEEINQKEGIVWLSNLVTPREVSFSENNTMIVAESVALMPVKVKAIHFVVIPPKTSKKHLVDEIATKIADTIERKEVLVHTRGSTQEIASVLQAFGLSKEGLPKSFGGSWKYEEFTKWQRQRSQFEQTVRRFDGTYAQSHNPGAATEAKVMTEAEKKERKRQLNVIHSRQKRERRKAEAEELKSQCATLEQKNRALQSDNSRLENLLADVKRRVAVIEQGGGGSGGSGAPGSASLVSQSDSTPQDLSFLQPGNSASGGSDIEQQLLARQFLLNQGSASGFPLIGSSGGGGGGPLGGTPFTQNQLSMLSDHSLRSGLSSFQNPSGMSMSHPLGSLGGSASFLNHSQLQQSHQQQPNMDMSLFLPNGGGDNVDSNNGPSSTMNRFL